MKRLVAALILIALAAVPAAAQGKKKDKDKRGFVWDDRPTIVFGDHFNIALKGRALVEWRWFDPDIKEDTFHLRTARIGLKGELGKDFDWEIEREITEDDDGKVIFGAWKDVAMQWKHFDAFSVKGGRFKVPFGMEQTTGVSDLDFAYRALGSTAIAPGRDRGMMAFGDLGHFNYEAGVFDDDGDNAESNEPQFVSEGADLNSVGPSIAARVTGDLLRALPVGKLRSANFGVAYTNSDVPEGLNSLRAETVWGKKFFDRVYVKGRRQRIGAQFNWTPGSAGINAEWMQAREQRNEQSNRNEDLSDVLSTAWYVSGTWYVTGEKKDKNIKVKHPFLKGGVGAIELAARYEEMGMKSASTTGTAFTNPRADHLLPNSDKVWTAGVNWTTSKWTRVIVNAIHESIEDPNRTPAKDGKTTEYWSSLIRLNIVF
jgi:phosphate-selective porin